MLFEIFKIFALYGLTAPTNVMCLGAFTEFWLCNSQLTRLDLTNVYLLSTICVFFILQMQKVFFKGINLKLCFSILSIVFIVFSLCNDATVLSFFLFFFFSQWIGQGLIVEECRVLLAYSVKRHGLAAGGLESLGMLLVYLIPFIFLWLLKEYSWQILLFALGLTYAFIAFGLKNKSEKVVANVQSFKMWSDVRFLIMNSIIYLPVLFTSGFFFHLEAFIDYYQLSLVQLELCAFPQMFMSILFQLLMGFLMKSERKYLTSMYCLLFISQVFWLINLLFIHGDLFYYIYILMGSIGWGCFGLLVNIAWKNFFDRNINCEEICLRNSVSFGFLANAIGPLVLVLLLR